MINTSQNHINGILAEIAFYRAKIKPQIESFYHVPERSQHNNGLFHQQFLENKEHLEKAVASYIEVMHYVQ